VDRVGVRRGTVFDLGNVLVSVEWDRAIARAARHTDVTPASFRERVLALPALVEYEEGRLGDDAFCDALAGALDLDLDREAIALLWQDIFTRRPAMEALFAEVCSRAPVAILSDTSPLHIARLRAMTPIFGAGAVLVPSYEIGVHKPDPRAYAAAAAALDLPPEACCFVDDLDRNVAGARAAGMTAFRYSTPADARERIGAFLGPTPG
jgi:putative hydrolase of the HAD superfamily